MRSDRCQDVHQEPFREGEDRALVATGERMADPVRLVRVKEQHVVRLSRDPPGAEMPYKESRAREHQVVVGGGLLGPGRALGWPAPDVDDAQRRSPVKDLGAIWDAHA
jgi:hypothetical protein